MRFGSRVTSTRITLRSKRRSNTSGSIRWACPPPHFASLWSTFIRSTASASALEIFPSVRAVSLSQEPRSRRPSSARSRRSAVSRGRPGWNRPCVPESADQRHNRELIELLNELRVALPGVQVLFAFLLAVPFANGFPKLGRFDRDVFHAAFVAAALSTVLLIAPSSYHRLRWRHHDKERMLRVSKVLTIVGLFFFA